MEYLIFSDESGCWNEGDYYLRSWVRITPNNYEALRKELIFIKHETGIKELKWKSFRNNLQNIKNPIISIHDIDYSVFITISIPEHFQKRLSNNRYVILRTLSGIKPEQSTGGEQFTEAIKNKIISAAQHTIFYSYYEKQHIENAKFALVGDTSGDEYRFVVDTPQCLDKDWIKIANECGVNNVKIEKRSEKVSGIELTDIIAGCIHDYLRGEEAAANYYKECIRHALEDFPKS
jgi:hypothetical protein